MKLTRRQLNLLITESLINESIWDKIKHGFKQALSHEKYPSDIENRSFLLEKGMIKLANKLNDISAKGDIIYTYPKKKSIVPSINKLVMTTLGTPSIPKRPQPLPIKIINDSNQKK